MTSSSRVGEGDLLAVDGVVAPAGRQGGERPGPGPSTGLADQRGGHRVAPSGRGVGQRSGQDVEPVAVEEAGVGGAGDEGRVAQRPHQQVAVGGDPVDAGIGQDGGQRGRGLAPGRGVHDDLGQHRVVVGADRVAGLDSRVDPDPGPVVGHGELVEVAGRREPPGGRVLRVQAGLDGVAHGPAGHRLVHLVGQGRAPGHQELQAHEVEPGHLLGHRVLDLEAGVHLQEVGLAVVARSSAASPPPVSRTNSTVPALT